MTDQQLIDEIKMTSDAWDDFDEDFVDSVQKFLNERGYITPKQRSSLERIYNALAESV